MKKAIIFISYHPQYLVDYVNLCEIDGNRSQHILILCKHSYLSETIINEYSKKFDNTIFLPDIDYNKNIFAGFMSYAKFKKAYLTALDPVLRGIDSYCVISCCSAWLPVNALLTALCRNSKFKSLFTVCEHIASYEQVKYLRTFLTLFYTLMLRLRSVNYDRVLGYFYKTNQWNGVFRFIGSYEDVNGSLVKVERQKTCYIRRPARRKNRNISDGIVIFYSDRHQDTYKSTLSEEEWHHRVEQFMHRLGEFYSAYTIVCKPHPLDNNVPIDEMRLVRFKLCEQSLLTQMHLQLNIDRVVACYSICSTSLLYSASIGIPSYNLFKYLGYDNVSNLKNFFDSHKARQNPYLYNLSRLEEIGKIDNLYVELVKNNNLESWGQIMYSGNV